MSELAQIAGIESPPPHVPAQMWYRLHLKRKRERVVAVRTQQELRAVIAELGDRYIGAERVQVHECAICRTKVPWGPSWRWYGSLAQWDAGEPIVKLCGAACQAEAIQRGLVPANAPAADLTTP
jgi:hypothetical protein